jgi:hypothetical protein
MSATSPRLDRPRRLPGLAALLSPLLLSSGAWAQATPAQATPSAPAATPTTTAPAAAPDATPATPVALSNTPSLDEKLARQQAEIDALLAKSKEQEKAVTTLRQQASSAPDEAPLKLLSFWGFSDLTFGGIHYDSPTALYKVATPSNATFYSTGINLYAKSEMTRTLSALVETMLTYTPNGATPSDNYASQAYVGSTLVQSGTGTPAANTTVHGPYSQLSYRQDGIVIERAYLEWKPADWFGVRAGRFLTPFGIWNEDHGSPVLIGVDYPQFMNFNLVPLQQLGLEAFGSVGLGDDVRMEYAVTFANSNGPSDEYKDLTDMKALGARLKLVYSHDDLYLRLGGYAYYNNYVDSSDAIVIHLTPKLTLDNSIASPGASETTINESSNEIIVTGDLDFRFKKFRLLGEFANQTVIYNTPPTLGSISQLLKGIPLSVNAYDASHYGYGGYVMAAYEVPFHTKPIDFSVTPYVGYDYVIPSTTVLQNQTQQVRGGLNIKPSPYVTLKVEVARVMPTAAAVNSQGTAIFSQIAFSF